MEDDFKMIAGWFDHIAQIATDRKTGNGVVMLQADALSEIALIAKEASFYINYNLSK